MYVHGPGQSARTWGGVCDFLKANTHSFSQEGVLVSFLCHAFLNPFIFFFKKKSPFPFFLLVLSLFAFGPFSPFKSSGFFSNLFIRRSREMLRPPTLPLPQQDNPPKADLFRYSITAPARSFQESVSSLSIPFFCNDLSSCPSALKSRA